MIICTASINSICKICLHHEGCCIDVDETSRAKEHYCELYILNYTTSACRYIGSAQFYKYAFDLVRSDVALWIVGHNFGSSRCCFFDSWQLSIINSIVYGIGTLPEAKMGPVKRMPKRGMDSCRLHVMHMLKERRSRLSAIAVGM